jgi:phosphoadenosine phosphosulfate reductase
MKTLSGKIEFEVKLLRSIPSDEIELCFSGGKDSVVILELAKMAGINYRAIYKSTTIDPPGTVKFCRENGCEVLSPKYTFFQLIEKKGFPTMRCRFCCDYLKEYKVLDHAIMGIRRSESVKRMKNYKEPQICRIYSGKQHVSVYLPILEWTDGDVLEFIQMRNLQLHPLYYRADGTIDVTKRLGCLTCPLKSDRGLAEFTAYPNFVKAYIKAGMVWWNRERKKPLASHARFGSIYDLFFHNVFCNSYENYRLKTTGMFGKLDCKKFLEDYFKIELP